MHRFCYRCGTPLLKGEQPCSACGTSIHTYVPPSELGNCGSGSGEIEADRRRRVRLILTGGAAIVVLLLGILAILPNRSSPPKNDRPTDARQDAKPMISHGEKPSAAIAQRSEVVTPIASPRNESQDRIARQAPPANEEANKGAGRADGSQSNRITQSADHFPRLQFATGDCLWIRVNSINRQPSGSFDFRGALLHPITLSGSVSLDQSTELVGSGTMDGGHITVSVTEFNIRGEDYGLKAAGRTNRKPGSGPALELNLGKILEMWFASASVYEKTR
jgi:predicted  nucleic acid-binding Zn-ribbon protein